MSQVSDNRQRTGENIGLTNSAPSFPSYNKNEKSSGEGGIGEETESYHWFAFPRKCSVKQPYQSMYLSTTLDIPWEFWSPSSTGESSSLGHDPMKGMEDKDVWGGLVTECLMKWGQWVKYWESIFQVTLSSQSFLDCNQPSSAVNWN